MTLSRCWSSRLVASMWMWSAFQPSQWFCREGITHERLLAPWNVDNNRTACLPIYTTTTTITRTASRFCMLLCTDSFSLAHTRPYVLATSVLIKSFQQTDVIPLYKLPLLSWCCRCSGCCCFFLSSFHSSFHHIELAAPIDRPMWFTFWLVAMLCCSHYCFQAMMLFFCIWYNAAHTPTPIV